MVWVVDSQMAQNLWDRADLVDNACKIKSMSSSVLSPSMFSGSVPAINSSLVVESVRARIVPPALLVYDNSEVPLIGGGIPLRYVQVDQFGETEGVRSSDEWTEAGWRVVGEPSV